MKLTFTHHDCFEHLVADSVDLDRVKEMAQQGQKIKVKLGIDPTSPDIHLGRTLPLWRLRAFQELGHEIHLIIGSFTARVGDTSDKDAERPILSPEQITANISHYEAQLWRVLNPARKDQVTIHYNHEWLQKLGFSELITLADAFSVNQFVKRELIAKRLDHGLRVSLRELFYPIMQGYDSVMVKADLELGGSDQWFNLLAGRVLQERAGQTPQAIITGSLIVDSEGVKMSSSQGNGISLNQEPFDFYTAVMQVNDSNLGMILDCLPLSAQPWNKEEMAEKIRGGENPRNCKMTLAKTLVELFWGVDEAQITEDTWNSETVGRNLPENIETYTLVEEQTIIQLLVANNLAASNTEARRLVEQGGVRLDGTVISSPLLIPTPGLLQVGKHRFLTLVP